MVLIVKNRDNDNYQNNITYEVVNKPKKLTIKNMMFRKMSQAVALAIFLTAFLCTVFLYKQYENSIKDSITSETGYIKTAVELYGMDYLNSVEANNENRITLINSQGDAIFDSEADIEKMNNHLNRKEVAEAIKDGEGFDERKSDTLSVKTFYYAVLLKDGSILRVATDMESILVTILNVVLYIFVIGIIVFIIGYIISYFTVKKIVNPINNLNLENPENNHVYEEIRPLLKKIVKQNEFIREQTITENESREQMRREFSANVSHELKTPLTSITGYAELMKSGMVKDADLTRFSEIIYAEATRMTTLIEDIIKISRLDEEGTTVEWTDVDLLNVAKSVVERLKFSSQKRNVTVDLTGKNTVIRGEEYIVDEILYNLVENAIKYNCDGGKVYIRVYDDNGKKLVQIRDTGIGIDEADQKRVFERFYRVDKSHSRSIGGTGLGLSIVKHGVLFHKASIEMESKLGEGTTIRVIF